MDRGEISEPPSHEVSDTWLGPASESLPACSEWRGVDPSPPPQCVEDDSKPGPSLHTDWDARAPSSDPTASDEDRLAQLAGAVGPLRRVLAAVAARLIETKAYERLCYARLSDYARERAGLSARQLQELAKVHRALAGLPGLERALIEGVLPWSKLRLLARVATAEDEDAWIARARVLSTRQLEREVRERAGGSETEEPDEAEPHKTVRLRCTPAVREKWRPSARRLRRRRPSAQLPLPATPSGASRAPSRHSLPGSPRPTPSSSIGAFAAPSGSSRPSTRRWPRCCAS